MARPRVFVSHSSTPQKCAADSCACVDHRDAVVALLDELGCDAVVDQGVLRVGDQWHPKLMRELACCQATILLISPHALDSEYVYEEVMLSMFLWEVTQEHFLVLPVMLPGVQRDDLGHSRLARFDLDRFDMVDWPAADPAEEPPARLGDRVRSLVAQHGSLPYPRVTEHIATRIEDVSAVTLSDVARELGVAHIAYAHDHTHYVVSAGLLSERPVTGVGAGCAMRSALRRLMPGLRSQKDCQEILDMVVPFARVPGVAADELRTLCASAPEGRVALLSARRTATAQMYVRRASELPRSWPVCTPVPRPGMDFVESVIAEIHDYLAEEFDVQEEEVGEWLVLQERESGPVTVVLAVLPDAELVRRLLGAFPKLLFLFTHDRADLDEGPSDHTRLTALTPGQEREMGQTYRQFFNEWVRP
jgi:hypothetical protein